ELMPVLGNHEVVFGEFEAGQRVYTTGDDLLYATRCECMSRDSIYGKRCRQDDRMVEVRIAAAPQVLFGLSCIAIIKREFAEMKVNFAQPRRMRRFVCMLRTPSKFL